jgi:hypothetical protein
VHAGIRVVDIGSTEKGKEPRITILLSGEITVSVFQDTALILLLLLLLK